ncbi:sodium:proton antiporter [Yimella sp. cx-573]|nr:sodium:proton antiporter [Yimella sp. cx-573]
MERHEVSYEQGDDGRGESPGERLDRNWNELLQELRVTQTGIQILFAFLLILPFQARFDILEGRQLDLYVAIIGLITAATLCIISPVIIHRLLFRRRAKDVLVTSSNWLAVIGLVLFGLALVCAIGLIVDVVAGKTAGFVAAGLCGVVIVALWVVLPAVLIRRSSGEYS